MKLDMVKAAARAVVRRVGAFSGYVRTKRCWRCHHMLSKRAMVCPYCHKWQA
jgi:hypothetical protein